MGQYQPRISFDIPQARRHLVDVGFVYTLRAYPLPQGRRVKVRGLPDTYWQEPLGLAPVSLEPWVVASGFSTVQEWRDIATRLARGKPMFLYKVWRISRP